LDSKEFSSLRQRLQKTQKQMAQLLGTSLKAVQSFEQGWRKVPVHIERQVLFLISNWGDGPRKSRPCWVIRECSTKDREACPAWEFNLGHLCWGEIQGGWSQKMKVCRTCEVFGEKVKPGNLDEGGRSRVPREGKEGRRKAERGRVSSDKKIAAQRRIS
jgi:hypothetical protein